MLGFLGFVLLALLVALARAAAHYWPVTLIVLGSIAAAGLFIWKYRRDARQRTQRDVEARLEANRQAWRALTFQPGGFTVTIDQRSHGWVHPGLVSFLTDIPVLREQTLDEVHALVERAVHVGPQTIAEGIAQIDAVNLKEALERRGAKARIKELAVRTSASGREPIPARVRDEVWRRDGGRCVDCASRERLEYDHIIPIAKGGSNTARNIELRCETCNRKKGARI